MIFKTFSPCGNSQIWLNKCKTVFANLWKKVEDLKVLRLLLQILTQQISKKTLSQREVHPLVTCLIHPQSPFQLITLI